MFKGRNIQEFSVGDTSVGDTSTLHPFLTQIIEGVLNYVQDPHPRYMSL